MSKHFLRPGGLMRCCIESLADHIEAGIEAGTDPSEGDTVACKYADWHLGLIYRDGAWEWNRTAETTGQVRSES